MYVTDDVCIGRTSCFGLVPHDVERQSSELVGKTHKLYYGGTFNTVTV